MHNYRANASLINFRKRKTSLFSPDARKTDVVDTDALMSHKSKSKKQHSKNSKDSHFDYGQKKKG